jgi:A/G-specific adenine glycosylase
MGRTPAEPPAGGRLLAWFDRVRRELPWRGTRDPYRILVSEVMLQQTRAETVIPYFERFLGRFPTRRALARAPIEEVLAQWSGLGYYGRARRLHAAVRALEAAGRDFPRTAAELEELPGIGPYTAAAVASIAFDEAVPVLDGNAIRVLARRTGYADDPRTAAGRRHLLAAGAELIDSTRPGDSNQALMELGATLCSPRAPRCNACPLTTSCVAAGEGDPERYPAAARRRATERRELLAAVVERDGRFLVCRRPEESSLLAGTWEIPWAPRGEDAVMLDELGRKYGGRWSLGPVVGSVRHTITYRILDVEVRLAARAVGRARRNARAEEEQWLDRERLDQTPLSSLVRKVLGAVSATRRPARSE